MSFNVEDIRLTPDTESRIRELDEKASEVAKEALERRTLDMSRKEERQFDVADLAASNKGAGSIISPLVGASVGMGIAGGIASNVMKSMPGIGTGATPPPLPEAATTPPVVEYMVAIDGKQYGPYPVTAIAQFVREGRLTFRPETLVWRAGWPSWVKYEDCQELSSAIGSGRTTPPPLPSV